MVFDTCWFTGSCSRCEVIKPCPQNTQDSKKRDTIINGMRRAYHLQLFCGQDVASTVRVKPLVRYVIVDLCNGRVEQLARDLGPKILCESVFDLGFCRFRVLSWDPGPEALLDSVLGFRSQNLLMPYGPAGTLCEIILKGSIIPLFSNSKNRNSSRGPPCWSSTERKRA